MIVATSRPEPALDVRLTRKWSTVYVLAMIFGRALCGSCNFLS